MIPVIKEKIGAAEIYIQALSDEFVVIGEATAERDTQLTAIDFDVRGAYERVRRVVKDIAQDFGEDLKSISSAMAPHKVSMELSLGVSAEGRVVWLIGGKSEFGLKVELTWNLGKNKKPSADGD